MTDRDPDYVVLGETRTYSFEAITKAIRLIAGGARFIATNPDPSGPSAAGLLPATGSVAALISTATGRQPYFIGKPNPLMMRSALNRLEAHSETTVMVGDRMDTDIISGLEAGLRTVLVSTGSTRPEQVEHFPYRPTRVVDSIADLVPLVTQLAEEGARVSTGTVLHLAEVAHWHEALRTGEYRWSTLGRTLEEEGFIHCATPEQVPGVLEPLLRLVCRRPRCCSPSTPSGSPHRCGGTS